MSWSDIVQALGGMVDANKACEGIKNEKLRGLAQLALADPKAAIAVVKIEAERVTVGAIDTASHVGGSIHHRRAPGKVKKGKGRGMSGNRTALEFAQQELAAGVCEASGKNDGIPHSRYFPEGQANREGLFPPWCAAFVRWCYDQAGTPLPGNRWRLPGVAYMETELESAGARLATPEAGAVITFWTRMGSDKARGGRHVGIVEKVHAGRITTIEGNSGDRVGRRTYNASDRSIAGFFRWPRRSEPC